MTEPARWFNPSWLQEPITVPSQPVDLVRLREVRSTLVATDLLLVQS